MIEDEDLYEFQRKIAEYSGSRILIGSRQIGKTATVVKIAVEAFEDDRHVAIVAPQHQQCVEVMDRIREHVPNQYTTKNFVKKRRGVGTIESESGHTLSRRMERGVGTKPQSVFDKDIDVVLIDEANYVDESVLFYLDREFDDTVMTATPSPKRTVVESWAKNSPYHETWHVTTDDVDHFRNRYLRDFAEELDTETAEREIDASLDY